MRRRLMVAALVGTGLVIVPAAAAQARPPMAALRLTVIDGPAIRTVTLTCAPPGGTHPQAARACTDLERAHGDLSRLPGESSMHACFMIYAPVRVLARGWWRGRPVEHRADYANRCLLRARTGPVFAF